MEADINLFNINHNLAKIGKGKCLISEPFSPDSYFGRSIVLVTEYSENEGAIGYILNKPIDIPIKELFPDFPPFNAQCFIGGPVNPETIHFLHTRGDLLTDSTHIYDNIYWGGNFEELKSLVKSKKIKSNEINFFLGYSGWSPEQILQEIDEKYWIVSKVKSEQIMKADKNTWKDVLNELGDSYSIWANSPENPELN